MMICIDIQDNPYVAFCVFACTHDMKTPLIDHHIVHDHKVVCIP